MAETSTEKKLSLKIMVDMKARKVVFAEADKEFVDFLFSLMNLPLSIVAKVLLNQKGMVSCLGTLYNSIKSLDTQLFKPNTDSSSVLKPKASLTIPLLSVHDWPASSSKIFRCPTHSHSYISDVRGTICCNNREMTEQPFTYVEPKRTGPDYVNGGAIYIVMDNLDVKPMSIVLVKSFVKEVDNLEERQVQVGLQEGLAILKASLESNTALSTAFLNKI